jgi:hypothetical protein
MMSREHRQDDAETDRADQHRYEHEDNGGLAA